MSPSMRMAAAGLLVALSRPPRAGAATLPIHIVTSIPPLAMIASEFGGNRVLVRSILPPGADPHTFEPRPSDSVAVAQADIVVVLGSSIDDWIGGAIAARDNATVVRLDESPARKDVHAGDEDDHDPHVWLDPSWVRDRVVPALQRALTAADPEGAPGYGVAARAMAEELADLDDDVRAILESASTRYFIAWHPAWERFATHFGLHSVAAVGESEGREPSLRAMIGAVRSGRAAGVRAVLVEPQVDSRQAAVLAGELGVPMVTVDPLGDASSLERATYTQLMLFNAQAFARALAKEEADAVAPVSALPASPGAR